MAWFRFYTDVLNDPKVQRLDAETFRTWVNLLCLAKEHDGVLPDLSDVAFALRMSDDQTLAFLTELEKRGLIDVGDDGTRTPHNWEGRQYPSDSSTERTRRYRARKAPAAAAPSLNNEPPSLQRHSDGTEQSRADTEQSRAEGVTSHAVTPDRLPLLQLFESEFGHPPTPQEARQIADLEPAPDPAAFAAALYRAHANDVKAIIPWVAKRLADAPVNGTGPPLVPRLVTVEEHLAAGPRRGKPLIPPERPP